MNRVKQIIFISLLCSITTGCASYRASSGLSFSDTDAGNMNDPAKKSDIKENHTQLRLTAGSFTSNSNPGKLTNKEANVPILGIGISKQMNSIKQVSFDFDTLFISRRYNTTIPAPLFSRIDDYMTLVTIPITGGLRVSYPTDGIFHIYANAGGGIFLNSLKVNGSSFGMSGEIKENDTSWGWYTGAGISLDVNGGAFAIDYKILSARGSFEKFGISDADIGGEYIGVSYVKHY